MVGIQNESAAQFRAASRNDLAEKEDAEVALLTEYLPAQMSEADIVARLKSIIEAAGSSLDKQRGMGMLIKEFYAQVDKAAVQGDLVAKKARELLSAS